MGKVDTESRSFRLTFGRPRLWNGFIWIALAVCYLALTASGGGNSWGYLLAALWGLLGAVVLTVAVRDRRRGRGAYARPQFQPDE